MVGTREGEMLCMYVCACVSVCICVFLLLVVVVVVSRFGGASFLHSASFYRYVEGLLRVSLPLGVRHEG